MKYERVPETALPKDYENQEEVPWFVHNRENPEIADRIERRADVYIRRIERALKRVNEFREKRLKDPNYREPGGSEEIDFGWYNDLVAAAEDAQSAEAMARVEELSNWTKEDFAKLIATIHNASPEIREALDGRKIKENNYKPGYDSKTVTRESPIDSITRILNGARASNPALLEEALSDAMAPHGIPKELAEKVFHWQLERMIDGTPGTRESEASWRILQMLR